MSIPVSKSPSTAPNELSEMFGRIAPRYDLLNRLMTGGLDRRWRRRGVAALTDALGSLEEGRFLDLATGTADFAIDLLSADGAQRARVDALDLSEPMLLLARQKAEARGLEGRLHLHHGAMENLPFPDGRYDGITIGFGIRNAASRPKALREMHRVLKPGGVLVILEALPARHRLAAFVQRLHFALTVRLLGGALSEAGAYQYLEESVARFPKAADFVEELHNVPFEVLSLQPLTLQAVTLFVLRKPAA